MKQKRVYQSIIGFVLLFTLVGCGKSQPPSVTNSGVGAIDRDGKSFHCYPIRHSHSNAYSNAQNIIERNFARNP